MKSKKMYKAVFGIIVLMVTIVPGCSNGENTPENKTLMETMTTEGFATEITEPVEYDNLITDAYSTKVEFETIDAAYYYQIPLVNLKSEEVILLNEKVYDDLMPYVKEAEELSKEGDGYSPECGGVSYSWGYRDNILSLVIKVDMYPDMSPYTEYFTYNIDIADGTLLEDKGEVLSACDVSEENYKTLVETALCSKWWDCLGERIHNDEYAKDEEYIRHYEVLLEKTISEENIKNARPYINKDGNICIVGQVYLLGELESSCFEINLLNFKRSPYYSETVEIEQEEQSINISEKEALEIAKEYWGIEPGDVDPETGYEYSISGGGLDENNEYIFKLKWFVIDHSSTVDVVAINAKTGECRYPYED